MKARRPRNIGLGSLLKYSFPFPAIASILHRISGVILFILIPFILWLLHVSLTSQMSFLMVKDNLASPVIAFFIWITLSALLFHSLAGIRHILMDLGFFEEKLSGKIGSIVVMLLATAGIIGLGVWIIC